MLHISTLSSPADIVNLNSCCISQLKKLTDDFKKKKKSSYLCIIKTQDFPTFRCPFHPSRYHEPEKAEILAPKSLPDKCF